MSCLNLIHIVPKNILYPFASRESKQIKEGSNETCVCWSVAIAIIMVGTTCIWASQEDDAKALAEKAAHS